MKATGYSTKVNGKEVWSINYSSILTELIKCAGRYCTNYASDLFIEWDRIVKHLENPMWSNCTYMFGFRDSGVDDASSIEHNIEIPNYYDCIKELTIRTHENEITMELEDFPMPKHKQPSKYRHDVLEDAAVQAGSDALYYLCQDFGIEVPDDGEDEEYMDLLCGISNYIENHA